MVKLSLDAKKYIVLNEKVSNRKLQGKILEIYNIGVSHKTIGNFKNSIEFTQLFPKLTRKVPKKIRKISSSSSKKNGFDFSIDGLKLLLDKNPDHYWHNYLKSQVFGKKKLRSDIQKLFDFLRDVT